MRERLLARLDDVLRRYEALTAQMADPAIATDHQRLAELAQEQAELEPLVETYRRYREISQALADARGLLEDEELRDLAREEGRRLEEEQAALEEQLKRLLLPRDPNDDRNVILEIRAGTGGEEAALFAADLARMYMRYAEAKGWKTEILSASPTDIGGYKEIILLIKGKGAYSRLKYESGVHRVQRVPVTEASGRIHTSTATVAVLPEMGEVEVHIDPKDLRIETFRASGPGGQHVNRTDSAVRITHLPTGIVVSCQDAKSQHQNRQKALQILRARLYALEEEKRRRELDAQRRSQVGTGERSEKIRTYNFPQNRVTDHRIGLTLHRLQDVLDGDLDEIIDALVTADQTERLTRELEEVA